MHLSSAHLSVRTPIMSIFYSLLIEYSITESHHPESNSTLIQFSCPTKPCVLPVSHRADSLARKFKAYWQICKQAQPFGASPKLKAFWEPISFGAGSMLSQATGTCTACMAAMASARLVKHACKSWTVTAFQSNISAIYESTASSLSPDQ